MNLNIIPAILKQPILNYWLISLFHLFCVKLHKVWSAVETEDTCHCHDHVGGCTMAGLSWSSGQWIQDWPKYILILVMRNIDWSQLGHLMSSNNFTSCVCRLSIYNELFVHMLMLLKLILQVRFSFHQLWDYERIYFNELVVRDLSTLYWLTNILGPFETV